MALDDNTKKEIESIFKVAKAKKESGIQRNVESEQIITKIYGEIDTILKEVVAPKMQELCDEAAKNGIALKLVLGNASRNGKQYLCAAVVQEGPAGYEKKPQSTFSIEGHGVKRNVTVKKVIRGRTTLEKAFLPEAINDSFVKEQFLSFIRDVVDA